MTIRFLILFFLFFSRYESYSQNIVGSGKAIDFPIHKDLPDETAIIQTLSKPTIVYSDSLNGINKKRVWLVAGANIAFWTGTYIALNTTWYSNYPRSSFHFFNDNTEWEQMDKLGHIWTAYQLSRAGGALWKWTGLNDTKSAILGGLTGIAYQSIIEVQDGFSSQWGFSWGDMTANVIGASSYVFQQLGWKDQRIQIKLSYWPYDYSKALVARRNDLFGTNPVERLLKDYNSQTYWLDFNLKSFLPDSHLPPWLNLSAGYSADGMLGATNNKWIDKNGVAQDYTTIPRVRRWLLSADVDLTKIKTKSKFLKTIFFAVNVLKIPAPALELDSRGRFKGHLLYY